MRAWRRGVPARASCRCTPPRGGVPGQLALAEPLGEDRVLFDPSWRKPSICPTPVGDEEDRRMVLFGTSTLRVLPVAVLEQERRCEIMRYASGVHTERRGVDILVVKLFLLLALQSGPLGEQNARATQLRAPAGCRRGALHHSRRLKVCAFNAFRRWHLGISVGAAAPAHASPQPAVGGSGAIPGAAKRTAAGAASGALRPALRLRWCTWYDCQQLRTSLTRILQLRQSFPLRPRGLTALRSGHIALTLLERAAISITGASAVSLISATLTLLLSPFRAYQACMGKFL
jgi:hypothetical protein